VKRATTIRSRLLASFLVIVILSAAGLSFFFLGELQDFAVRKLTERLDGEARLVAAVLGRTYEAVQAGTVKDRDAGRAIVQKALEQVAREKVPSRLRIVNLDSAVVADTQGASGTQDMRADPGVRSALSGQVGGSTRSLPDGRTELSVSVPIIVGGTIIGASVASASTFSIRTLLSAYRSRLAWVIVLFVLVTLATTELLARWLARPLSGLERGVSAFGRGDHAARVTPSGSRETRAVATAFNGLADEVETVVDELRDEELRKSRFVSDVSHELRTPLTAIRGAAETLMEGDVAPEDASRFLSTIVRESNRLTRLANDLLVLQRIEGATGELPLRDLDLSAVVRAAVEALGPLMEEREVTVTVTGEAPHVLGDGDRIQQVVGNLVDNASRVTPSGGRVEVTLARDGRWSTLAVHDGGPGIPADDIPHVFERFYRSQPGRDRRSGGVGLGLSIVKAIVTSHLGEVQAANAGAGGAVFTVRLPALERRPEDNQ
jgi:two-component system OmpR family sensor kinase